MIETRSVEAEIKVTKKRYRKEWVTEYRYTYVRPCGHTHVSSWWQNYDAAAYHERWSRENTLCGQCYEASLSPEQRAILASAVNDRRPPKTWDPNHVPD